MNTETVAHATREAKAKVKIAAVSTLKPIANLAELRKEYVHGKMAPRKIIALKERLMAGYKSKEAPEEEMELLETILRKIRSKGSQVDPQYDRDTQIINWIERNRCTMRCTCVQDSLSGALFLTLGRTYFYKEIADGERYVVYVEYDVPPEHQMTRELVLKEARGHFANEDEYPKTRTDIRVLEIDAKRFAFMFQVDEDLLSETGSPEEQFIF